MRILIPCAGDSTRWDNYRGVPKHLAPICGEPILERTVRLANEIRPDADIKVVVGSLGDRRYLIDGSSRTVAKTDPARGDIDKIVSSAHAWGNDRTVIIWGDIWWSRDALTDVLASDHDDWHAWMRIAGEGGELFGFSWPSNINDQILAAIDQVITAYQTGGLDSAGYGRTPLRGGWALYRALTGVGWDSHGDHGQATQINDWTDDFDGPADWDRWCYRWATTPEHEREAQSR